MKKLIWIVVLVLVVVGIMKLSGGDKTPVASGEVIKIGWVGPLTGDAAVYGEPARNVTALAVEEINSNGGINGRMVEMIYEDGKCTGPGAVSAAQKLINIDKVEAIVGGFCSGESLAMIPVAEVAKVVMLSPGSSSPDLTGKSKYFFRNYPSDATQGRVLAEHSANTGKWDKVAVVQEQTDYALGNFKAFSENFSRLGGTVIKEEFASNTTDFRSILTKLKAAQPDALYISTQTPAVSARILKQLNDLGWKPSLLVNDATSGDTKLVGDNKTFLEGAFAAEFGIDATNQKFQKLLIFYKTKYDNDLPFQSYAQTEYDAVFMIAEAVKQVGYDGEKIANWSRTVKDWLGASGLVTINADGDRIGGHVLKVIRDGKVVEVK